MPATLTGQQPALISNIKAVGSLVPPLSSNQSPPLGPQIFQRKEKEKQFCVLVCPNRWQFHRSPKRNDLIVAKSAVADCDDSII